MSKLSKEFCSTERSAAVIDAECCRKSNDGTASFASKSIKWSSMGRQIDLPSGKLVSYAIMMEYLKQVIPAKELKHNLTRYKKCFTTGDAIKAFRFNFPDDIESEEAAVAYGKYLQQARILTHVVDADKSFQAGHFFFRLQCYSRPDVLNSYRVYSETFEGDPMDLVAEIESVMISVVGDVTFGDTQLVDYVVASRSPRFYLLEDSMSQLQGLDLGLLDEVTRRAVTINIYNIGIKFAFMKVGAPADRNGRKQFFSTIKLNIGGDLLSFDDLEHGILRGNRPLYASLKTTHFAAEDPRVRLVPLSGMDPRIHFALERTPWASKATHLIHPETIRRDLELTTRKYLTDSANFLIDPGNREIHIRQIFHWYSRDFHDGGSQDWHSLAAFLIRHVDGTQKLEIDLTFSSPLPHKITFVPIDWGMRNINCFPFATSYLRTKEKRLS